MGPSVAKVGPLVAKVGPVVLTGAKVGLYVGDKLVGPFVFT